jgi:hypothetical protein
MQFAPPVVMRKRISSFYPAAFKGLEKKFWLKQPDTA